MVSTSRAFTFKCSPCLAFFTRTHMDPKPRTLNNPFSPSASRSPPREASLVTDSGDGSISLEEWQAWGTKSPLPTVVSTIVEDLKALENDADVQMTFGGKGGKLKGNFKMLEDKKHRAMYQALDGSEQKLQFYSARQIACRLLGSRGYLCQKCWLPFEDCMCFKITPCKLWDGMKFWLYMHPKDFLRQNNTGKLLWQIFGVESATLCLFGIPEHEEIMWNAFKLAGQSSVWCLYPNKNAVVASVQDAFGHESLANVECRKTSTNGDQILNFVLIDGTWSNSAAMFRRLKEKSNSIWGEEDIPCISLATGASAMHKLRPQPSWDRTCTAAAAIGLLSELQLLPQFSYYGLDQQAEAIEDVLVVLLEALTTRRLRMGRSITRKAKKSCPVNFESQNYTIITSQCKGPQFPPKHCCQALKEFACPFADSINNLQSDCSSTMFSYINLYGKYPPGLFASQCREGKEGLDCTEILKAKDNKKNNAYIAASISSKLLILPIAFSMFLFQLF